MGTLTFDEYVIRGRAVRYLLDQTTHWQPDGEPVRRLVDLETSHLSNIRNYLLRHRRWFYFYDAVGQVMPVLWRWFAEDFAAGARPVQHYDHEQIRDAVEGHCPFCHHRLLRATEFVQSSHVAELADWAACWICNTFWRVGEVA